MSTDSARLDTLGPRPAVQYTTCGEDDLLGKRREGYRMVMNQTVVEVEGKALEGENPMSDNGMK
jgi:hypothetical protein